MRGVHVKVQRLHHQARDFGFERRHIGVRLITLKQECTLSDIDNSKPT